MPTDLSYPIGRFTPVSPETPAVVAAALDDLAALPQRVREAVAGLTDAQLDTPYRPGGWTVRQVVHHLADSHMNGIVRLKLALTEDTPTIKPYDENAWAALPDMTLPIAASLPILDGIHERWVATARTLSPEQLSRAFFHPEMKSTMTIARQLQLYAWHSRHHVAHITALRHREGW